MSYSESIIELKTRGGRMIAFSAFKIRHLKQTDDECTEVSYTIAENDASGVRTIVVRQPYAKLLSEWKRKCQAWEGS